jgi:peptide/nickel transport system permease protein
LQTAQIIDLKQVIDNKHLIKKTFWLGTDNFGRDNLSRLLLGVRVSLLVGLIAVLISLTIGILLGALAGFFGGRIDDLIMLIINTVWSIPTILLVFAIVLALGRGIGVIFLAVGLTMWVDVARIVRGQVLSLKEMLFIEATRSMGFSTARTIWRHILPNVLGPVMVVAASNFATAILVESGLSYLGFGIQPPAPSWGTMLNENYGYAIGGKPFLAVVPALAILLMVLAFNLVGNGFRDALDVKTKD